MIVFFTTGFYMDAFGLYLGPVNSFSIGSVEIVADLSGEATNASPTRTLSISADWDVGIVQSIVSGNRWFPYGGQFVFTPGAGTIQCGLIPNSSSSGGEDIVAVSVSSSQLSFSTAYVTVTASFLLLKRV